MSFSRFLKVIHDFPDYTVDIYGRVFNRSGKELKQWLTRDGYCMVRLCRNGYEKSCSVHRLVADAFFDGNHDGYEVNHIDGWGPMTSLSFQCFIIKVKVVTNCTVSVKKGTCHQA